ncbi:hypothetical protein [Chryseobacterium sp. ERMR1:04]|uniref:hypothetical protein n=1 Tax=Chryseobacterium sp. ERMR1:04 TaxID=1705393 RepID=UPI0006C83AC9|nr:hypothetical protein [Chryseobacterium sp. ERMR1:04]
MTAEQEKQITGYLIFQKLPLDILFEVKDHMISQVLEIQCNDNLDFDEAFHKTKKLWESEFKLTHYYAFYSEKIPVIVKKIVKERYNNILKKSLLLGLLSFGMSLLLIYFSDSTETYTSFFRAQNCLFLIAPLLVLISNYKMRKYIKTDFKYKGRLFYTMYQQNMGLLLICTTSMAQIISKEGKYGYLFFKTGDTTHILFILVTLILPFLVQTMIIFFLINFFEHKKTIIRLQNSLNPSGG